MDKTRQYYYGDEARIQCYKGYKQIGSNIVKCNADQEFDTLPMCEGIILLFNNIGRFHSIPFLVDINECIAAPCDVASTECVNTPGSFYCQCKAGFSASTECRPVGDLGLATGGISDNSISVSSTEDGYEKSVSIYIKF